MSFGCVASVTPRPFLLLEAVVKGAVFLISFSAYLSFVHKKATVFYYYYLILYPATLLKMFISYRSSLVEVVGSLIYTIISSAIYDSLTSSFPIFLSISFSCLIALVKASGTILTRSEGGGECTTLSCSRF